MNHSEEIVFEKLRKKGWHVLHNGHPDFIIYKLRKGNVVWKGIEVKSKSDKLSKDQIEMQKFYNYIHVPFVVEYCSKKLQKNSFRKYLNKVSLSGIDLPPTSKSRIVVVKKKVLTSCCECGRKRKGMKSKGWIPCAAGVICSGCLKKSLYKKR